MCPPRAARPFTVPAPLFAVSIAIYGFVYVLFTALPVPFGGLLTSLITLFSCLLTAIMFGYLLLP